MKYKVCTYTNRDTYLDDLNKSYQKYYDGEIFVYKNQKGVYENFYELLSLIKIMFADYDYIVIVDDDIQFINDTTIGDSIRFIEQNDLSLCGAYMTKHQYINKKLSGNLNIGWVWGYYMMFKLADLPVLDNFYRRESKFMNCDTIDLNKVAHQDIEFCFRFLERDKKIGIAPVVVQHIPHYNKRQSNVLNKKLRKLIGQENVKEFYNANKLLFNNEEVDVFISANGEIDLDLTLGRYFLKKQFIDYNKYMKMPQPHFKDVIL